MRFVEKRVHLPGTTVEAALGAVYGDDTIRRVYGAGTCIGPWSVRGRPSRRLELKLDRPDGLEVMPSMRGLQGSTVGAMLRQRVVRDEPGPPGHASGACARRLHEVHGSIKLRILGAELIKIRPRTVLSDAGGGVVEVHMGVEMHAVLPPPLDRAVEDVMARQAAGELDRYAAAVVEALRDGDA